MGGVLSAPKAPAPYIPVAEPQPQPQDDTQARVDAIERRRRGLAGTVTTSERGLLALNAGAVQKKSLLGE